jgi:hypothetical protein
LHAVASAVSSGRGIDELDKDTVNIAARINAVTSELLCQVRELAPGRTLTGAALW